MLRHVSVLSLLALLPLGALAAPQEVLWIEAESYTAIAGEVVRLDAQAPDYGPMARTAASGECFLRFANEARLTLPAVELPAAGEWSVWVRHFPIQGRAVSVAVDGREVGRTDPQGQTAALTWARLGAVTLTTGKHSLELCGVQGNTNWPYVDVVALLPDATALPYGRTRDEILRGPAETGVKEEFSGSLEDLAERWTLTPPPGADAAADLMPAEDDGALHVHNGAGAAWSLTSRRPVALRPGQQLTVRVRLRKGTLTEWVSLIVPGVGSFSPQLYRRHQTAECTWLVPPGAGPVSFLQLVGRGGGDTYISRLELFSPSPPVSPFGTGRFLPPPNPYREGRMFQLERYVVNAEAFTEDDVDADGRWTLCRLSREQNTPWFAMGTVLKSDSVAADRPGPADGCPPLHLRVGPLLPGTYSVFLSVPGRALAYSRDGKQWRRLGGTAAPDLGVVGISDGWFEFWLDDRYAEPGNPGPTYADYIRFMPVEDPAYTMQPVRPVTPPARGRADDRSVALTVANPSPADRVAEPVRSGVPVPQGDLADASQTALVNERGEPVPCFVEATGLWPDGSVKWLLLDFLADVAPRSSARYLLHYGNSVRPLPGGEITRLPHLVAVTSRPGLREVDTGAIRLRVTAQRVEVFPAGAATPALVFAGAEVRGTDGQVWRSDADSSATIEIESGNPLRRTLCARGRLLDEHGAGPLRFEARWHCFAGRPDLYLEWGFYATEAQDTVAIRSARLLLQGSWAGERVTFGLNGTSQTAPVDAAPRLLQTGASAYGDQGAFPFALTSGEATLAAGEKAAGWVQIQGAAPMTLALEHFWQQFPKAVAVTPQAVAVDLWPDAPGVPPFVAHAGAGKSHRLGISLGAEATPDRWLQPLFAACDPAWYCASGAFENLVPRVPGRYDRYEEVVAAAYDRLLRARAGHGMEDWGDVWQAGYVPGAKTWSNQEWDLVNNWVIPFVRTGNLRYLDFAHEAARHFCDVDTVHYARNPDAVGGTWIHCHTSEVGHQLEAVNFAHAGWVEGLYNLYHLTGDRRGVPVAAGIADWICRRAPQVAKHPENGPAYPMSIQRPVGWPLTTLCLAYRETGKLEYLQAARRLYDWQHRYQDPDRGVWEAETGHERPFRGGCVFAYTLCRGLDLYAQLTGEKEPLEDYARAAKWMLAEMWRPGHAYLYEQVPIYDPAGSRVPFTVSEMAGKASRLTGDPLYVTVARCALEEHAAAGAESWMVDQAAHAQWGNGINQQVPRMLYDWGQTGLRLDPRVTVTPQLLRYQVSAKGSVQATFLLSNTGPERLQDLRAHCLIRGDWQAKVLSCPDELAPQAQVPVTVSCQPPPPLAQYELQSDRAYVHLLVRYREAGAEGVCWNAVRVEIAPPLEVAAPPALALRPGQQATLSVRVANGSDESPVFHAEGAVSLKGLSVGAAKVTPLAGGAARVDLPVSAAAAAPTRSTELLLTVRSGRRERQVAIPVSVGRVRVLLIESGESDEWQRPFNALRVYDGLAPEFLAGAEVARYLPASAAALRQRWEVIALGDTGTGAAAFTPGQLQALAEFTKAGGGLLLVGGARCYTAGGYDRTPLAPLLPVDLRDGRYAPGDARVTVTEPKVRLFENYDPAVPPFRAHQLLQARPGARVLATFDDGTPFLALSSAGEGRVAALGAIWNNSSGAAFAAWPRYGTLIGRLTRWLGKDLELD